MKLCPKCGTQFPDDANFCPADAARLVEDERASAAGETAAVQSASGARVLGGRFVQGARIGGRQTGEVYRGTDQKQGRPCAIKLVDASVFPGSLAMQRTERELGKLSRLDAEGIARILGHGKEGGTLWIASELVPDCQSLHDLVFDEGPMPVQRAAALVVKVGKALAEAARIGVIHRDLAPKNVLMGAGGAIKIINFGVAVPATARVHGVPEFVAPEIIEGKQPDQRANIYSLGALFYYVITGRPPYMGEPEDVHTQHLKGWAEPPSAHVEGISEAVDGLILRALERSSSKRFMTLRQLLGDVERVAEGNEPLNVASSLARMGRGKNPKLAQTMLGGFRVVEGSAGKAGSAIADGSGPVGATGPAGSSLAMGSPVVGTQDGGASSTEAGNGAAGTAPAVVASGDASAPVQESGGAGEASKTRPGDQVTAGEASAGAGVAVESAARGAGETSPAGEEATGHLAGASAARDAGPATTAAAAGPGAAAEAVRAESRGDAGPSVAPKGDEDGAQARFRENRWFEEGGREPAAGEVASTKAAGVPPEAAFAPEHHGREAGATGARRSMQAESAAAKTPASSVSDRERIDEMKSGRRKIVAAIVIGILLIGIVIAIAVAGSSQPTGQGSGPDSEGTTEQPAGP